MASDVKTISEAFATRIIEQLEQNTAPFMKPWKAGELQPPVNPVSGTVYKGVNALMLASRGHNDPRWCTFQQAQEQGWTVKKGEKAEKVVFWQISKTVPVLDEKGQPMQDDKGEALLARKELDRPIFRVYSVFHASQLRTKDGQDIPPYDPQKPEWEAIPRAENILGASGADIVHDQRDRAYYSPKADQIHLPDKSQFLAAGNYYSTALHELGHWTGHESRQNREFGPFGSETYAKEELRAEIGSWMINQELGLPHDPSQHTAYVKSWIGVLKKDPYEIMRACTAAEKIKDQVLTMDKEKEQVPEQVNQYVINDSRYDCSYRFQSAAEAIEKANKIGSLRFSIIYPAGAFENIKKENGVWQHTNGKPFVADRSADNEKPPVADTRLDSGQASVAEAKLELATEKIWLNVSYQEKGPAKAAGAKWDRDEKSWYLPPGGNIGPVQRWIPAKEQASTPGLSITAQNPAEEFAERLQAIGLEVSPEDLKLDGRPQRCPVQGKAAGTKDGAYCGFADGRPNGWGENHVTKEKIKWVYSGHQVTPEYTARDKDEVREELTREQEKAQRRAFAIWINAADVAENAYLTKKGVPAYEGMKADGENLLLPGYNLETGRIQTLQTIAPDGEKRFMRGCPVKGAAYVVPSGNAAALGNADRIMIAEGYATAASLHQATPGLPVVAALGAGNLLAVAESVRKLNPDATLLICADRDGVGTAKAQEAAKQSDAGVLVPMFSKEEDKLVTGLSDFNDMARLRSKAALGGIIEKGFQQKELEGEQEAESEMELAR